MIKLIQFYQKNISKSIGSNCKYYPSCSNYGIESYQKFNFFKATFLTSYRILRCNPFSKGGYDPVPLTKKEKQAIKNQTNK